jgi:cardiolipin synthase
VLVLFGVAAITDIGDGFFARLFNAETVFGACLDPLADKFLILSSFVALAWLRSDVFVVPWWFICFFFVREFLIIFGAVIVALRGGKTMIRPTVWGKATTFLQIIFIVWLTICFLVGWKPQKTYAFFLLFLVTFSFFSLLHYCKVGMTRARAKK